MSTEQILLTAASVCALFVTSLTSVHVHLLTSAVLFV